MLVYPMAFTTAHFFLTMREASELKLVAKWIVKEEVRDFSSIAFCVVHGTVEVVDDEYVMKLMQEGLFTMRRKEMKSLRSFLDSVFLKRARTHYLEEGNDGYEVPDTDGHIFCRHVYRYLRFGVGPRNAHTWFDPLSLDSHISIRTRTATCSFVEEKESDVRQDYDLQYLQIHWEALDSSHQYLEVSMISMDTRFAIDVARKILSCEWLSFIGLCSTAQRACRHEREVKLAVSKSMRLKDAHTIAVCDSDCDSD